MFLKLFATSFWNPLSERAHKLNSALFSKLFISRISKLMILPYCIFYGLSDDYLNYFYPESETSEYVSFGDFFKRKMKSFPESKSGFIWPCEGYICDWGLFKDKMITSVKGDMISPSSIFQASSPIPDDYFFTNIFLHNHNYHRVHSPVQGQILSIQRIAGGLNFLRPWLYDKQDVSQPALRNERLNIKIVDVQGRAWYLSMVGGFGVGTIKLNEKIYFESEVKIGDELGWFELGSTVCLATPVVINVEKYLQTVNVGIDVKIG